MSILQTYNAVHYVKCKIGEEVVLFLLQNGKATHYNIFNDNVWIETDNNPGCNYYYKVKSSEETK